MKKLAVTLLFGALALSASVRANQEPIIDGTCYSCWDWGDSCPL